MNAEELLAEANAALESWESQHDEYALTEMERDVWRIGYCFGRGVTAGIKEQPQ